MFKTVQLEYECTRCLIPLYCTVLYCTVYSTFSSSWQETRWMPYQLTVSPMKMSPRTLRMLLFPCMMKWTNSMLSMTRRWMTVSARTGFLKQILRMKRCQMLLNITRPLVCLQLSFSPNTFDSRHWGCMFVQQDATWAYIPVPKYGAQHQVSQFITPGASQTAVAVPAGKLFLLWWNSYSQGIVKRRIQTQNWQVKSSWSNTNWHALRNFVLVSHLIKIDGLHCNALYCIYNTVHVLYCKYCTVLNLYCILNFLSSTVSIEIGTVLFWFCWNPNPIQGGLT